MGCGNVESLNNQSLTSTLLLLQKKSSLFCEWLRIFCGQMHWAYLRVSSVVVGKNGPNVFLSSAFSGFLCFNFFFFRFFSLFFHLWFFSCYLVCFPFINCLGILGDEAFAESNKKRIHVQ